MAVPVAITDVYMAALVYVDAVVDILELTYVAVVDKPAVVLVNVVDAAALV